jgi:hypothetical protein
LSTHTRKALVDRFGEEDGGWLWERFTVHYTPKHGSRLNQAEIEIGLFSRECHGNAGSADITTLRRQAKAWNRSANHHKITIKWKFTRRLARLKLNYSFKRSGHWNLGRCIDSFDSVSDKELNSLVHLRANRHVYCFCL